MIANRLVAKNKKKRVGCSFFLLEVNTLELFPFNRSGTTKTFKEFAKTKKQWGHWYCFLSFIQHYLIYPWPLDSLEKFGHLEIRRWHQHYWKWRLEPTYFGKIYRSNFKLKRQLILCKKQHLNLKVAACELEACNFIITSRLWSLFLIKLQG